MFIPAKYFDGEPDPWEKQPVAASKTLHVGTALAFKTGKLDIASGATMPAYICMEEVATSTDGQMVHVIRVSADTLYETELAEASASIAAGTKYTLDAFGEKITATSTNGVAEVVSFEGTAAGDHVRVCFHPVTVIEGGE